MHAQPDVCNYWDAEFPLLALHRDEFLEPNPNASDEEESYDDGRGSRSGPNQPTLAMVRVPSSRTCNHNQ